MTQSKTTKVLLRTISTYIPSWPVNLVSLLLCFTSLFYSCKDPKRVSLERQVLDNPTGIGFVDTFSVKVETIRIDTPSTKNQSHIIVGKYSDDNLGVINASAYTQLSFSGFDTLNIDRIDSVQLKFNYEFMLGDTVGKSLSFDILKVTETIDSATKYTSISSLSTETTPLESISLKYSSSALSYSKTITSSPLIDTLNRAFGKTEVQFKQKFPGIQFVPTSNAGFAIGIRTGNTSGITFTVYGHKINTADTISTPYILNVSTKSQRFVSASYDITKFPLGLNSQSSLNLNNKGIMNDLLGIRTRISFPGLSSFLKSIKEGYNLMEAYIVLSSSNNFSQSVDLPYPRIYLMECANDGNASKDASGNYKIVQSEKNSSYSTGDLYGTSAPFIANYDNLNTRFKYPFTLYAKEIQKGGKENNPFIVSLTSYYYNDTQTPMSYSFSTAGGIKLLVYYNKRTL